MKKLQIKFASALPKEGVELVFVEGSVTKFSECRGVETLLIGAGDFSKIDKRGFSLLVRKAIRFARSNKIEKLVRSTSFYQFKGIEDISQEEIASLFMEAVMAANYEFDGYKSENKYQGISSITFVGNISAPTKRGLAKGHMIGEYINICRDIANTPGGDMTPDLLEKEATKLARGTKVNVSVLDAKKLKALKAEAILAVGKGSKVPPRMIVMEYWGAGKPTVAEMKKQTKKSPIALVGKGITFDSGGLSLKPAPSMLEMHMDMSGGASVIATVTLAAKLGLKKNVVGIIAAAENMVSGESYRPGDIIKAMNGTTIEVLNTDAEGRVVLADALSYVQRYNPKVCIDIATLTGAAVVALGERVSAVMTKDKDLQETLVALGEESMDRVWPLPLWDEYNEDIRATFGDIGNTNTNGKPYGGSITAGAFLSHFVGKMKWAHIDMAPRMTSIASDNLARGATGEPVRLLLKTIQSI